MPLIETSAQQIYRHPNAVVSVADVLREQDFVEVPYLRVEVLRDTCGPEISQANLWYDYGDLVREDRNDVDYFPPEDLIGKYVRIVVSDTVHADDPEQDDLPVSWYGIIELDERAAAGSSPPPDNHASGRQLLTAFGLLRLLEKEVIRTSIVDIDGTESHQLTSHCGLPFNLDNRGQFVQRGNRSAERLMDVDENTLSYVFAWDTRGAAEWTAYTAVDYLLRHHCPTKPDGTLANVWRLDADANYLDWYDISVETDARTVKEVLDALIPRQRAVGYWVEFDISPIDPEDPESDPTNEIVIHVFTALDVDVPLANGKTIKANPNLYSIDAEQAYDIQTARIGNVVTQKADRVIVRGAKRTTTFTARIAERGAWAPDVAILPAWTENAELEYKAGASEADDYAGLTDEQKAARNEIYRSSDRLREVFRRFTLNPKVESDNEVDWRWHCKIPHPHSTDPELPTWWLRGDQTQDPFTAEVDPGSAYKGTDHIPALRMMRALPLFEGIDYTGATLEDPDSINLSENPGFVPLMAYGRTQDGDADVADLADGETPHRYELLDRLRRQGSDGNANRDWACRVSPVDNMPGFELHADVPHFLDGPDAGSPEAGYATTSDDDLGSQHSGLPYAKIWATVCVELTERLQVEAAISVPTGASETVIVIDVPDARHDYVLPHTTVEIRDGLPVETTGGFAKDDTKRLETIRDVAAAWYSTTRQTLSLSWKQIRGHFQLGWLITDIGSRYQLVGVNTPITAIEYRFGDGAEPGSTSIETAYTNLDFTQ